MKMTDIKKDVARFDRGVVSKATITNEGYLKADAIVTRTGVFLYQNADGTIRRELRHPDDVFQADSLDSLKMKPITNGHPKDRLVTSDNAKELSIGYTGETVRLDGQYVITPVLITDQVGVEEVKSHSKRELSLGYTVDLIREDGVYNGLEYTHRQTNIKYNHLAIVDRARAGSEARIHLDKDDAEEVELTRTDERFSVIHHEDGTQEDKNETVTLKGNEVMAENQTALVTLDGIDYKSTPEVANAYQKACKSVDEFKAKLDSMTTEFEKLKAEKDALSEKYDAAINVDHSETIREAVKTRVSLITQAKSLLGEKASEINMDDMSDLEIRTTVVKEKCAKANLDGASEVYIQARFDSLVEDGLFDTSSISKQREVVAPRFDGRAVLDADDARKKMMERFKNAWKGDVSTQDNTTKDRR